MRILHVGKYYAPQHGGIERYTRSMAEWCIARGDAVAVLAHQPPGRWRSVHDRIGGVDVYRAGCLAAPLYTPLSPTFPLQLARVIGEFRPDLLHLHLPNPSCVTVLASGAARRLPWIAHWHADVPADAPDWRMRAAYRAYRPFEQRLLRKATAIVATSQPYRDASPALQPFPDKTRIIPLGVEEAPPASPMDSAWPGDGLRVLAVGRLSRYKGFDVMLRALAAVPSASLVLVGEGECENELRTLAHRSGIESRVSFAGALDDDALLRCYASTDVFVLPSLDRGEAFGMVLLEAMRARKPVVASAVPGSGIASVVGDGETGLLVAPGDAEALAAALRTMQDAALRDRLGSAGHARWRARFSLAETAARMRTLYEEVLAHAIG